MSRPLVSLERKISSYEGGFVPGWSIRRVWLLSLTLTGLALLVGWLAGPRLDLIGLLIAGPCCALLTGRWRRTALAAVLALGAAVVVAALDGEVATAEHAAFLAAVAVVGGACTMSARVIERHLTGHERR